VGGNFVNRFDISGRSYKVIPQIQRVDRLNRTSSKTSMSPPGGQLVPLSTIATLRNSTVPAFAQPFQQLNASRSAGCPVRPLDEALQFLEDEAAKILPKATSSTTRRVAPAAVRRQPFLLHLRAGGHPDLPGSGRGSSTASAIPSSFWPGPCRSPCSARSSSPS